MRTVRFELLRQGEILYEKKRCSIVFLPIGPLEWHGPHLPLGVDPLNAEAVSRRVAENVGGVVMPTFFWGTERERSSQMLKNIGFRGDEWVVGMDFPKNSMKSLYIAEDVFGVAVREYLRQLVLQEYKLIVIVNGHGGENHLVTLKRLAAEFTANTESTVLFTSATCLEDPGDSFGHATRTETSIISCIYPDSVDNSTLPPDGEPLYNLDWAIVDGMTFQGFPNESFTVREDPRKANAELGKKIMDRSVEVISQTVRSKYNEISK